LFHLSLLNPIACSSIHCDIFSEPDAEIGGNRQLWMLTNEHIATMSDTTHSIERSAVIACRDCDLLHSVKPLKPGEMARCSRCGALLYQEKGNSIARPFALVIGGLILFFFANYYTILTLKVIGTTTSNTLMAGVIALWDGGLRTIAILVFLTSIFIPFLKLILLFYILYPLALFKRKPPALAFVFRTYLAIDCWGMLEVYMLSVIVAISKLGDIATVQWNMGLYAFVGLFLVTFGASASLDPRIIWEKIEEPL